MMNTARARAALGVALFVLVMLAPVAFAGNEAPPFSSPGAVQPNAAPNPPYISISRYSTNAVRLDWGHPDTSLTSYEVWRSELPYFTPSVDASAKVGSYAFSQGIYGEYAPFSYIDNGSCGYFIAAGQQLPCSPQNPSVTVIGDVSHQYYWLVRASNGEHADSNRVGEFDFALVKGS